MPPIEEADFVDTALVWACTGYDRDNEPVLAAPEQVPCRWTWQRRVTTAADGTPLELTAKVALPLTVRDRSVFWLGRLAEWNDDGKQELYQAVGINRARSVDGKGLRREYDLTRFKGKLPAGTPDL